MWRKQCRRDASKKEQERRFCLVKHVLRQAHLEISVVCHRHGRESGLCLAIVLLLCCAFQAFHRAKEPSNLVPGAVPRRMNSDTRKGKKARVSSRTASTCKRNGTNPWCYPRTIGRISGRNDKTPKSPWHPMRSTSVCYSSWSRPGAPREVRVACAGRYTRACCLRAAISPSHLSATLDVVSTGSSVGKAASVYLVNTGTRDRNAFG